MMTDSSPYCVWICNVIESVQLLHFVISCSAQVTRLFADANFKGPVHRSRRLLALASVKEETPSGVIAIISLCTAVLLVALCAGKKEKADP